MKFAVERGGHVIQDHIVKNGGSDIDFDGYQAGAFSVGIEGGSEGAIVDLGSEKHMEAKYGYRETSGGGQGFASIRFVDDELVILKDYRTQNVQPLLESQELFGTLESCAAASVQLGHIYLVRLTDRHDDSVERIVKFKVVGHVPGQSVTIRWFKLKG